MSNLKQQILSGKKIISVYGLGNVGGPIAAAWLRKGATVIGVDISDKLLKEIANGTSHSKEPHISDVFSTGLKEKKLILTSDGLDASKKSQIKFVAVPVALKKQKIDLSALFSVAKLLGKGLKKGDAIVICPSLPPGTTQSQILPIIEKISNLKADKDFYLIYNPERIFEGRALQDIEENYPAIVSGCGPRSLEFADELLKMIAKKGTIKMTSMSNAEAEKLFEGVYRDVNIALANELAQYSQSVGVDFWEARIGANSQPYCHLHYPGTGVGGLCIPVYPRFVIESSKKAGKPVKIIETARKINDSMPKKCVDESIKILSANKRNKKGTKVAVLGLGFRGDVVDSRLSPTYAVVDEFLKRDYVVAVHDPYITRDLLLPKTVLLSSNLGQVIKDAALVFVSTDHKMYSQYDQAKFSMAQKPLLIFDGRNILAVSKFKDSIITTIGK